MTPGGRCTCVGMEEAPRSRLILLVILERAQLTVMVEEVTRPLSYRQPANFDSLGNDSSYEDVFSEQLRNFVQPGDVAVA